MVMEDKRKIIFELDAVLGRIRRFWANPTLRRRLLEGMEYSIDPSMYAFLRAVESADSALPGITEIAAVLQVNPSAVSRLADQAADEGYIARVNDDNDRRRVGVQLTGQGQDLLRRATLVRLELWQEFFEEWSPEAVDTLIESLRRLDETLASYSDRWS